MKGNHIILHTSQNMGKYFSKCATLSLYIILLVLPTPGQCEAAVSGEGYFFHELGEYFTAPLRWDSDAWLQAGLITGGILIVVEKYDDKWKQEMVSEEHPFLLSSN